jgi:hypothetical protein
MQGKEGRKVERRKEAGKRKESRKEGRMEEEEEEENPCRGDTLTPATIGTGASFVPKTCTSLCAERSSYLFRCVHKCCLELTKFTRMQRRAKNKNWKGGKE